VTSASSSRLNPMMQPAQQRPVPARTALSELAVSPSDLSAFATLAGPHIDGFDCHVTSLLKADAAGNFHAFSTSASDRATDERMASGLTFVRLTIRTAPPVGLSSASAPANNVILAARLISEFSLIEASESQTGTVTTLQDFSANGAAVTNCQELRHLLFATSI
jgi:hypothetical protein